MDSHRKVFCVLRAPTLSLVMLALVNAASAGMLGALNGCRTAEPARLQASDSNITSTIQAKLASDGDLKPFGIAGIAVTTKDGVVTLKGRVKTDGARGRAERYARETDGVQQVIDLVKVGDLP